jgi:hypothetical protein
VTGEKVQIAGLAPDQGGYFVAGEQDKILDPLQGLFLECGRERGRCQ